MGGPMAGHLIAAGRDVLVWNRTPTKAEWLRDKGAKVAASLDEVGSGCDVVFLCVNRSEDVKECLDGVTASARPGTLFVDHSTIAPPAASDIQRELASRGFRFVDAPVTGGSVGAEKGQLTIFLGGNEPDVEEAMPLIKAYAKRAERVGGPGAGQMAKMANQIAVGGALLALCESLSFAHKAGLDVAQMRSLVGGGAGGSWAFENYGPKILSQDWSPGFSIKNQRKDFAYCDEAARAIDAAIPGTHLVDRLLGRLQEAGHGEWTTAALYEEMLRMGAGD
jgi:3-hydroxyisobutyrate dehydrogenase-like beta-hydroxyacid dehydrogenase